MRPECDYQHIPKFRRRPCEIPAFASEGGSVSEAWRHINTVAEILDGRPGRVLRYKGFGIEGRAAHV